MGSDLLLDILTVSYLPLLCSIETHSLTEWERERGHRSSPSCFPSCRYVFFFVSNCLAVRTLVFSLTKIASWEASTIELLYFSATAASFFSFGFFCPRERSLRGRDNAWPITKEGPMTRPNEREWRRRRRQGEDQGGWNRRSRGETPFGGNDNAGGIFGLPLLLRGGRLRQIFFLLLSMNPGI